MRHLVEPCVRAIREWLLLHALLWPGFRIVYPNASIQTDWMDLPSKWSKSILPGIGRMVEVESQDYILSTLLNSFINFYFAYHMCFWFVYIIFYLVFQSVDFIFYLVFRIVLSVTSLMLISIHFIFSKSVSDSSLMVFWLICVFTCDWRRHLVLDARPLVHG